ncbi:hypothetical protein PSQ40_04935 [Curvibacter sp. HBC61]|uniref:Uncharacterized protein n=1 Tax=Curvibacter cyanobacteriorum TaxID=3026422 RepID=A0ABT5MWT2_9BURK|nr:hypothetical protein [Curvibacter sp. HBC61]MDD0837911.1 hypothetical protein [Curvibacter sp. HBC61]
MANALYVKGKEKILSGAINFVSDTLKVALVKNTYPQNLSTDEFLSTISSYVVGTAQTLASKSVTGGAFNAAAPVFPTVAAGDTCEAVVIYKDTGNAATSPLLAYIDVITGFPVATNGSDITVQWDGGAYKIFSL